jgi:hypothetical protein
MKVLQCEKKEFHSISMNSKICKGKLVLKKKKKKKKKKKDSQLDNIVLMAKHV